MATIINKGAVASQPANTQAASTRAPAAESQVDASLGAGMQLAKSITDDANQSAFLKAKVAYNEQRSKALQDLTALRGDAAREAPAKYQEMMSKVNEQFRSSMTFNRDQARAFDAMSTNADIDALNILGKHAKDEGLKADIVKADSSIEVDKQNFANAGTDLASKATMQKALIAANDALQFKLDKQGYPADEESRKLAKQQLLASFVDKRFEGLVAAKSFGEAKNLIKEYGDSGVLTKNQVTEYTNVLDKNQQKAQGAQLGFSLLDGNPVKKKAPLSPEEAHIAIERGVATGEYSPEVAAEAHQTVNLINIQKTRIAEKTTSEMISEGINNGKILTMDADAYEQYSGKKFPDEEAKAKWNTQGRSMQDAAIISRNRSLDQNWQDAQRRLATANAADLKKFNEHLLNLDMLRNMSPEALKTEFTGEHSGELYLKLMEYKDGKKAPEEKYNIFPDKGRNDFANGYISSIVMGPWDAKHPEATAEERFEEVKRQAGKLLRGDGAIAQYPKESDYLKAKEPDLNFSSSRVAGDIQIKYARMNKNVAGANTVLAWINSDIINDETRRKHPALQAAMFSAIINGDVALALAMANKPVFASKLVTKKK